MDLKDCVKFANENPICYVATAEGDQPRVRAFMMDFADESGFYFGTLSPKEVSKQLKKNPKVEVCYFNNAQDLMEVKMMRVTGKIEFLDDIAFKKKIYDRRSFLKSLELGIDGPEDPRVEVFRIYTGEAHFWTMNDIMKEPELERIKF